MWVNRDGNEFAIKFSELFGLVIEGDDFSGADEGEIKRVEEEDNVFAIVFVLGEGEIDKLAVEPSGGLESGCGLPDEWHI